MSFNAGTHTHTHCRPLNSHYHSIYRKILFAITNFGILLSEFDAMLLLFMANKQILHKNELKEALIALSLTHSREKCPPAAAATPDAMHVNEPHRFA